MIPLEDTFADVVMKASRGLELSAADLADQCGLSVQSLESLLEGSFDESVARRVAGILSLDPDKLVALGNGSYVPTPVVELPGLRIFTSPFGSMNVNAYLFWDPHTRQAALVDTGSDCDPALDIIRKHDLQPQYIFLTHAHGDHILELDRLMEKTGAPSWISEKEPLAGANSFAAGKAFQVGSLQVGTALTPGHSPGGVTYTVTGLRRPVAFVGDALFAGSMGGANSSYEDALLGLKSIILSLPEETILCPGHGPLTTVAEQKANNPF